MSVTAKWRLQLRNLFQQTLFFRPWLKGRDHRRGLTPTVAFGLISRFTTTNCYITAAVSPVNLSMNKQLRWLHQYTLYIAGRLDAGVVGSLCYVVNMTESFYSHGYSKCCAAAVLKARHRIDLYIERLQLVHLRSPWSKKCAFQGCCWVHHTNPNPLLTACWLQQFQRLEDWNIWTSSSRLSSERK